MFTRALALLALTASAFSQVTVKDCDGSSLFKVNSLSFSPDIPVPNTNGTLTLDYIVPKEVVGGTSYYSCSLNGLPVWSDHYDLCTQTVCPISVGTHHEDGEAPVPNVSGKLDCKIHWKDSSEKSLLCVEFIMKLGAGSLRGFKSLEPIIYSKALTTLPVPANSVSSLYYLQDSSTSTTGMELDSTTGAQEKIELPDFPLAVCNASYH